MQYFVTSTTENVCLQKKQLVVVGYEKAVYDIRKNSQLVWEADSRHSCLLQELQL